MSKIINRSISLILSSFIMLCCTIQKPIPQELGIMERIIEVPNKNKDQLYISVNSWFVENFRSAESVIEFQDKEAGKVMGKYVYQAKRGLSNIDLQQTVSVDIKDNKMRIIISDPRYRLSGITLIDYMPVNDKNTLENVRAEWNELIESLSNYVEKESNW